MYTNAPTAAVLGIVMTQAPTMEYATFQCTARNRFAQPTPIMEPVTTCVVDTGRCRKVAVKIVNAELISAASPFTGSKRNILFPTVRIMRQPPTLVPAHMANAQAIFTRKGTSSSPMYPPDKSASVMIPMHFCASLNRGKMPLPRRISSVYGEKYNSLSIFPHSGTG